MKLAVFVCLLVPLKVAVGSCVNETVEVVVKNGLNLKGDVFGDPDPFVRVRIGDATNRTLTVESSSNPTWWTTFTFNSVSNDIMFMEIWDEDTYGEDDLLGICSTLLMLSSNPTNVECKISENSVVNIAYKCY